MTPSTRSEWGSKDPTLRHVLRNNQVGADQSASGSGETSQQGYRYTKGRIRHDSKWPSRQSQVSPVSSHHRDFFIGKFLAKLVSSSWV